MNLLQALSATPLRWTLQPTEVSANSSRRPDAMKPALLLTVVPEPGAAPLARTFPLSTPLDLSAMLVRLLQEQLPAHPVLQAWRISRGQVPVQLEPQALANLPEYMHTALRKLADSPHSILTWNALHGLHAADGQAVWAAARETVAGAFAGPGPVERRQLATALQAALVAVLDARRFPGQPEAGGEPLRRSALQELSLKTLYVGCQLTELDEWMWGWLGYVVNDAPPAPAASCAATRQ